MATAAGGPDPIPTFHHPSYILVDNDKLVYKVHHDAAGGAPITPTTPTHDQEEKLTASLLDSLSVYITDYLKHRFDMVEAWIPAPDNQEVKCSILLSRQWRRCDRLLVLLQNHVGSIVGMWSRSTCLQQGLRKGSMIPFLEKAYEGGYGTIICNPNANSVVVTGEGGYPTKVAIPGSSVPEEHVMWVYENYISQSRARYICLFGYGNGSLLCKVR